MFRNFPATIVLIVLNVIVFLLTWADAGTFDNPAWTNSLVRLGAQFNPFTLGGEWYRIFSHMFLHGHTVHLLVNMLALFSAGRDVESAIGTKKFVWLYFISGIGAALASLYWSMFTVGVGASGAIFGIFGFSVAISILHGRREGRPIAPIVINLLVFIFINVAVGEAFHADHAAHFGGLITGALLAVCSYYFHSYISNIKVEYAFIFVMVAIFFLLPRFQVHYYDFFKQIIRAEREGKQIAGSKLTDQQFLDRLAFNNAQWDSAKVILARHSDLPEKLRSDALTLTKYANFRKIENDYRIRMIKDETYILLDSIGVVQDSIRKYLTLEHPVPVNFDNQQEPEQDGQPEHEEEQKQMVRVWYDSDWVEIAHPGPYYRIGYRDSSNLWQGRVDDFYADGSIQMKGSYENDERDGVFLYYSHHNTYTSAGRYVKNRSVGKWQTFHNNGKLKEEIIYGDRVFYKNIWDSTGAQLVRDGKGKVTELYPDNSPKSEGAYEQGYKQGIWMGWYEDGTIHYKEEFNRGLLIYGKSRSRDGTEHIYDGSSLFPTPKGGIGSLQKYLQRESVSSGFSGKGTVRLYFRVTSDGKLTDFEISKSVSTEADRRAIDIVRKGPAWIPARLHGYEPVDGFAWVDVIF